MLYIFYAFSHYFSLQYAMSGWVAHIYVLVLPFLVAIAVLRRLQKALTSYIFVDRLRYKIMDFPAVSSLSSINLHGFLVTKAYFSVYVRFTTNLGLLYRRIVPILLRPFLSRYKDPDV